MACQLSSDPPSQDVAQQWMALQPCIAKHKWEYTWHMIWCWDVFYESNACILKPESHGHPKTCLNSWMTVWTVFINGYISSPCHSQSCDSGQTFAGSTYLIQKPKHHWPWVYNWLSWHSLEMRRAWKLTSLAAVFAHSQCNSPPEVAWPPRPGHVSSLSSQVVVLNL